MTTKEAVTSSNFIQNIISEDLAANKNGGRVHTRFPPEPNGYLHIGHAKSICLNFGLAQQFNGKFNLRFDDTNPSKEEVEFVESIKRDVKWLGADWEDRIFYASDYFDQLYEWAIELIKKGKAYVDDLSPEEIREYRGTLIEPGKNSPYRDRSAEENLDLFEQMKNGEFAEGSRVLRAKIDMQSPNMNMRDPILYRIMRTAHHRTGDKWNIYPMYDYAHPLSDAIEGITHSVCTLEFEDHRPLYNWIVDAVGVFDQPPRQIEFARLNLTNTIMSKRKLRALVEEGFINNWDDPRMPTISGMRRRGITADAIRDFCERIGVAKSNSMVDMALLESCIRDDLGPKTVRVNAVLRPLKVVITNYPEDKVEMMEASNHPKVPEMGTRQIPFTRELYIEQDDFMENAPGKFHRMTVGKEVRLAKGFIVMCEDVVKDEEGNIIEVHCTYDPDSYSGGPTAGRKVKGTIHWVSASHALDAEVRLYDRLMLNEEEVDLNTDEADFRDYINETSLVVLTNAKVEPNLKDGEVGTRYQFMRTGYFCIDPDTTEDRLVFNRIVGLRDAWAKIKKKDK